MKVEVGGFTFERVCDLQRTLRDMIYSGDTSEHQPLLIALTKRAYPYMDPVKVVVRVHPIYRCKHLMVMTSNGNEKSMSYKTLSSPCRRMSRARQFRQNAFRSEINSHIIEYRRQTFNNSKYIVCGITGKALAPWQSHIDHVVPFCSLVERFLQQEGIDNLVDVRYMYVNRQLRLRDRGMAERWKEFHKTNCVLRVVSIEANLTRGTG